MAEELGKRLLAEVEEASLDEILSRLRLQNAPSPNVFATPPLDRMLQAIAEARPRQNTHATPPIIELTSAAPGGGTTHSLYYMTALAVLPLHLARRDACVVVIDADRAFSVQRLVQIMQNLHVNSASAEPSSHQDILSALKHVHIFRPQSLASTVATIRSLPEYLFATERHYSADRAVAFIALDSASTFYWQGKAAAEDAAFFASITGRAANQQALGYGQLATALREASRALHCPVIVISWNLGAAQASHHGQDARSLRPSLPTPWPTLPTLKLVVQRVHVRKFPPGVSVEEAMREDESRQRAVDAGKFECFLNEWKLRKAEDAGKDFNFTITDAGIESQEL